MLLHQKLLSTSRKGDTRRTIITKKYLVLKQGQFVYVYMYMYDLYYILVLYATEKTFLIMWENIASFKDSYRIFS